MFVNEFFSNSTRSLAKKINKLPKFAESVQNIKKKISFNFICDVFNEKN